MKRGIDISVAATGLVVLSPVMGAIALAIRSKMGSPVLFRQQRPGLNGRRFDLVKFRTMTGARAADGSLLADGERLTTVGNFMRTTSLDELPQLWNVLVGEMSLVGPRPLLVQYLERYSADQARRHEVLPGITGWAQINGRNALSWEDKFSLDLWYVDNWSLLLDLKILIGTIAKVAGRRDVANGGHATMPEFLGNGDNPERM